jgi:hypothetical protein
VADDIDIVGQPTKEHPAMRTAKRVRITHSAASSNAGSMAFATVR